MSVKLRPYRRGGWEVDIQLAMPDGLTKIRERRKAPVSGKSAAQRWAEAREAQLLRDALTRPKDQTPAKEVPTLKTFSPRFIEGYAKANRHKASGIDSKESILRLHLLPRLGHKKLCDISDEDIQRLKGALAKYSSKHVNNVLTVLNKLLKVAEEWKVITTVPCRIRLLKVMQSTPGFYEYEQYDQLVEAAKKPDWRILAIVLLGGDAGIRRGEILALRQYDVDHRRRQLRIEKSIVRGVEDVPKGGRGRIVPMTEALASVLAAHRHLRGERVLLQDDGEIVTPKIVRNWMMSAQRRAGLNPTGAVHILRHTFCSHLAMRGGNAVRRRALPSGCRNPAPKEGTRRNQPG